MSKKIATLFVVFLFAGLANSFAQQSNANISFEKLTHNFGKIKEEEGKVTYKFMFTNTGNEPLVITNVQASCGCTSPSWTKRPVKPGEKGYVSTTFDPAHRPGNFNKSILVRTNARKNTTLLRIRGEVIPRKKSIDELYPKKIDGLRLKSTHLPFVKVKHNGSKIDSLKIVNTSDKIMDITFTNVPNYLELKTIPEKLMPGQKGIIWGKYDATKSDRWGFSIGRFRVKINGEHFRGNSLAFSAKVVEDFSHLTAEERKNAPKIKFENTTYDFGEAKQNSKVTYTFKFKNEGKRDLKIRRIRATCGCTTAKPEKNVIPPGESSSFKAIFQTGRREGPQRKAIHFISNDPENSDVTLMIKGKVVK
jgi:hypothetical protein